MSVDRRSCRRTFWGSRALAWGATALAGLLCLGCPPKQGAFDLRALEASVESGALSGAREGWARLGEISPYPRWSEAGLDLVLCRFEGGRPQVVVLTEGLGEEAPWARLVISAMDVGLSAVQLQSVQPLASTPVSKPGQAQSARLDRRPQIRVVAVASPRVAGAGEDAPPQEPRPGPRGLGDTLATCETRPPSVRGASTQATLVDVEIRMRRGLWNVVDVWTAVAPEEWAGAFAHELGHALGFQGHIRKARSLLGRDQDVLRRAGRAALAGEALAVPALEGLYALESGHRLDKRAVSPGTERWRARVEAALVDRDVRHLSRVGDSAAELVWVLTDGKRLAMRFPAWRKQLETGEAIIGLPTNDTRAWLREHESESYPARSPLTER